MAMSEKSDAREEKRRELKDALETMRREADKLRKDFTVATKAWVKATGKAVQYASPRVSATIDETLGQTSEAFRKGMTSLGKESRQFQVSFLRSYKTVLARQMDFIEKKLKELTK